MDSLENLHIRINQQLIDANNLREAVQKLLYQTNCSEFRPSSQTFNTAISKEDRHKEGIYFTPKKVRDRLFEVLKSLNIKPKTILEPCFGTGEFLLDAQVHYPSASLFGVEKNAILYNSFSNKLVNIKNQDFLTYDAEKVDCIVGNPPYCVTKEKNPECMIGKGNLFVQFLYKCVKYHLNDGGVLAFILPTSFLNSSYYQPCRNYIAKNTTIRHLEFLNEAGFCDTSQGTFLFVLENVKSPVSPPPYVVTMCENAYFSSKYKELRALINSTNTLRGMGFSVKTGEIVWNQHKSDLHDTEGTYVIHPANIVNNALVLNNLKPNVEKKQRVKNQANTPLRGPAIVVNRGYGNNYQLQYAYISNEIEFYGENHVNVITANTDDSKKQIPTLLASFHDPRTQQFIEMFVGNGALSKTELETLLPIFTMP